MGVYRLEIWFDYPGSAINWGVSQDTIGANPPFSQGGTGLAKSADGVVTINGAGNSSSFDIYLFDVSNDQVSRDLQWIRVDYELASSGQGPDRDPIADAAGLRDGLTGPEFSGSANGFPSGVGQEDTIFSAPSGTPAAQRRWSLDSGYEGLRPGHYTFSDAIV